MTRRFDPTRAFTLLETLVAMGLAVVLLLVAAALFRQAEDVRARALDETRALATARRALRQLRDDLAGVAQPGHVEVVWDELSAWGDTYPCAALTLFTLAGESTPTTRQGTVVAYWATTNPPATDAQPGVWLMRAAHPVSVMTNDAFNPYRTPGWTQSPLLREHGRPLLAGLVRFDLRPLNTGDGAMPALDATLVALPPRVARAENAATAAAQALTGTGGLRLTTRILPPHRETPRP